MTASPSDAAPTSASLWRNRDYLLLWVGQTLSDTGSAVSELAFPLLVLALTHSVAQAGFVAALRALPALLLTLPAGVLVDRWDRRRIMIACDVGRALALGSIAATYVFGGLSIWQLSAAAFVEGALAIIFDLAKTTALAQVATATQLTNAIVQDEVAEGATTLLGPSLSGALYSLSAMLPFLADAMSYLISIATLALIRTPFQGERLAAVGTPFAGIVAGARWVWRQPFILTMTLLMGASALVWPSTALITIILAQRAGASAWVIGLIFAVGGIGLLLGPLLASWLTPRLTVGQSILITRWYFALSWPLYALAPYPVTLGALTFGVGLIDPIEDVAYFSHRLRLIPRELQGRVIAVCRLVPGVARPLGLALVGLLIQRVGIIPTIWLAWGWLLLITVLVTLVPSVRRAQAI
jgi:MFS family permease